MPLTIFLGLAPTLPPKGTDMARNTVIDWKIIRSASLSMPVVYTAMPNRFDIRLTVSDVHPTVSETVSEVQLTVRLLHYQL